MAAKSKPPTVEQYLAQLPPERREALSAVRRVIRENLAKGFEEGMQYGMIAYYVPHSIYPAGYHCNPSQPLPFACVASQKKHMAVYLMTVYGDPAEERWLRERWTAAGKRLDMGKSCIRFASLDDVPLDVLGEAIRRVSVERHIATYESALGGRRPASGASRGASRERARATPARKSASRKPAARGARRRSR